jgi:hypothetical protein
MVKQKMMKLCNETSHRLIKIVKGYNLTISTEKTKVVPLKGKQPVGSKIFIIYVMRK